MKKCIFCDCPSLPGLKKGHGRCAYHWAYMMWGKSYADKMHPEHADKHADKHKEEEKPAQQ